MCRIKDDDNRYFKDERIPMGNKNGRVSTFIHALYERGGYCRRLRQVIVVRLYFNCKGILPGPDGSFFVALFLSRLGLFL